MRRLIYTAAAALACLSCIHEFPEPDILPEQGDEEKTRVTSNVSIRDGVAWGHIDEGRHRADDMYLGELFCYYVEIGEELSDHFGGDISGCALEFVSDGGGRISFED